MIRYILIISFCVIAFLLSLPFFLVTWIVGKFSKAKADRMHLVVAKGICRVALFLAGTRYTIIGREKIPKDTAVLYIINHRSVFDILMMYMFVPGPTGFIGKLSLRKIPVLNLWLIRLHGLFLDREDIRQGLKTILAAIEEIRNGISIAIFPEGTRGKDPDETALLPFHEGSFKVSTKTGCPIVPVAICGTSSIFEDHFPKVFPKPVIVEILDPIDPASLEGDNKKFPGRYVQSIVEEAVIRNHGKL